MKGLGVGWPEICRRVRPELAARSHYWHVADIERFPTNVRLLGKAELSFNLCQRLELFVPLDRELLEEIVELEGRRLLSFQDCFDDVGREQGEAQNATEVRFVDGFGPGKVTDGGVVAGLQHVAPAECADNRLHHRIVDPRRCWDPWSSPGGCHDLFAASLVTQRDRDAHRDRAAIFAQGRAAELSDLNGSRRSHAASWCALAPRSSLQSEVRPSTRSNRSMLSVRTSTRSTKSSTMRACSAGNNSFHNGSNSRRATRTWLSVRSLSALRPARQVWTMTSGVWSSDRI